MALTDYGVNNALAVKLWAKKLTAALLLETEIADYIGEDENSLIQLRTETQKGPGDQITYGLRGLLNAPGVQGNSTLEGNEEQLSTYSDAILINQLRHGVRSSGRISEQRVPFSVRHEALLGLKDWWGDRLAVCIFNQLCGYTAQTDTRFTGNNAATAPSSTRKFCGGAKANDENLTSSEKLTITMIDTLVEQAKVNTAYGIRPIRLPRSVNGYSEMYVLFIHPYQLTDLRASAATTGSWFDIQKAAMIGGDITKNPIFTGAAGMYNNVLIRTDVRVTNGVNSSTGAVISTVKRAVFCGAQAAGIAFGQDNGPGKFTWVEKKFDYDNELGVSAGTIFGVKKCVFNSIDYATIVLSTYAAQHTA